MEDTKHHTDAQRGFTRTRFSGAFRVSRMHARSCFEKKTVITRRNVGGFTILFAVLTSSLLLAIGVAIFNLTYRELLLSSSARDSQFAIYAADTGVECALYWDSLGQAFATGTGQRNIECAEQIALYTVYPERPATSTFLLMLAESGGIQPCTIVDVAKYENPTRTVLISRGYNTCEENNPRRVERALRVSY